MYRVVFVAVDTIVVEIYIILLYAVAIEILTQKNHYANIVQEKENSLDRLL